ncbi:MAG: Rieske 2Fe-2S domain-containing protein [Ktedonobacteraceae bacterium]
MTDQPPTDQVPDEPLDEIARRLDSLIQTFEQHPIVQVREEVMEMLGLIDALHRLGLRHLIESLQAQGPALLDQALEDPAVNTLLTLYDLLPPGPREQVEMALETVGPYIASQGGSIEVLDVIDGVVHMHLGSPGNGSADSTATLMQDIEMALREGYPDFRSIEVHDRVEVPVSERPGSFIPLQQVRTINRPVFTPVEPVESLPPGTLKGVEVEETRILLCNLDGDVYAYRNACAGSVLPLDLGHLNGYTLLCPWHNCLYDMRTGKRLDGGTGRLAVIPVAIRDGMIQLALNVEPLALRVPQVPGKTG